MRDLAFIKRTAKSVFTWGMTVIKNSEYDVMSNKYGSNVMLKWFFVQSLMEY